MFDIANFFSFLAALAVWDFVCHRQDFLRGFRSSWKRSHLPKGPKPEPLSVSLNTKRFDLGDRMVMRQDEIRETVRRSAEAVMRVG